LNDEVIRIRNKKSERERKRAEHIKHVNVDMNAPVQYPIFVLAHGPYRAAKTPAILRGCKLPYTVVVRESDAPQYQRDFPNAHLNMIDGIRVGFQDGSWALVRSSNTQAVLVVRIEATSEGRLAEIQKLIEEALDKKLPRRETIG
jgi:hypothetical protein